MNEDLKWLAENVHEWPKTYNDLDRLLDDIAKNYTGSWDGGSWVVINGYTRAQWQAARDELSGKPGWDDAPEWATHIFQDATGAWYFIDREPSGFIGNHWRHIGRWSYSPAEGRVLGDWRNTLERRPVEPPTHENHRCIMTPKVEPKSVTSQDMLNAAQATLESLGYRWCGGSLWKPPLGNAPSFAGEWRGPEDGLPPVGMRVELHNDDGYYVEYMGYAIGEEVTVKAAFYCGDAKIPMVAVEADDHNCGCFRVAMVRPTRTEEDKAIEQMKQSIANHGGAPTYYHALYRDGWRKQESK